jgi:hypothetical protein
VEGNITFSTPHEVSVVSVGFYVSRHVTSRRCFRHRIDRHHRGTSRWVPGNQCSQNVFYEDPSDKIHTSRFIPFSTSSIFPTLRLPYVCLDTNAPTTLLRLTGVNGSPPIADTKFRYWEPTLIVTSDLPL